MDKNLVYSVHRCMAQNTPKLVISLLIMGLITTVMMTFTILPIATAVMTSTMNMSSLLVLVLFTIGASSLQYVLQYGFFVLVFLLYTGNYAVLGHLFSGFRDFKRAFTLGLIFTLVYMSILFVFSGFIAFLLAAEIFTLNFGIVLSFLGIISFIVLAILYLHFGFAWFLLYENQKLTVVEALKQSIAITKNRKINFIKFCVKCASYFLLGAVICLVLSQISLITHGQEITPSFSAFLSSIVNFAYIFCGYISIMKICIAFAAWYVSYFDSPVAIEEIEERYANLPKQIDASQPLDDANKD